jgi:hypothetical protein
MIRSLLVVLSVLAYTALAGAGCDVAPQGLDAPDPDDEGVNLESMLTVAGRADITHGTQPYQPPPGAPLDEREERVFVAFLSGGQEVPPVATRAEGAMALFLNRHQNRLRFVLQHQVAMPTVAHLHLGSAGENGPVAVALPKFDGFSAGVVAVTPEQVAALQAGRLYVNVHSADHPTGEIRGQILRPGETVFVAPLRGSEEVPPVTSAASGLATLILGARRDEVRYRITATGITPTLAHVHRGIAGTNGPVVHPLSASGPVAEGTFPVTAEDLEDLSLRRLYVNLHSAAQPKGELRGQVVRPGEAVFAAALTPAEEVPPVTSDNSGNVMVVLGSAGAKFLYVLTTTIATPTQVHVHRGPAGVNGTVEVELDPVGQTMSGIRDLGPARRADIEGGLWYVNVHSAAAPKGELRGQLEAR